MQSTMSSGGRVWPNQESIRYLCPPDDGAPDMAGWQSPPVTPFKDPLYIPPVARPDAGAPTPPPRPERHQLYREYPPAVFHTVREREFQWQFHSDYGPVTWVWGINGASPGPTYHARYGEPMLVRRFNELPPVGYANVRFALPSTTTHLHNGHVASESDGFPTDWIGGGEFWDHHYPNFPATNADPMTGVRVPDEREKLTTLWYHDHRMDFTAANVYAGLFGMFLLFDEQDSGNENDSDPAAWRLPSGEFDVPLILQDIAFDDDRQLAFDGFMTHGLLGDRFTVNRIIQPHFQVKRRKYRFRILNAAPSRFFEVFLNRSADPAGELEGNEFVRFVVISGDGNLNPEPVEAPSLYLGVAQRVDVIIDFSTFSPGDSLYLENRLEQYEGHGPSGRHLTDPEQVRAHRLMRFDVVGDDVDDVDDVDDPSRIPDFFRPYPQVDIASAKRERIWRFDYDGGLWTVNGMPMDADRIDAGIEIDSAEVWTYRNDGITWSHPVHSHLSEWLVLAVNGVPMLPDMVQINPAVRDLSDFQRVFTRTQSDGGDYVVGSNVLRGPWCGGLRRDVANLGPLDEVTVFSRWPDFLGPYVLHCHNIVHEDHSMMIRWDVVPAGADFTGSRSVEDVYGAAPMPMPMHNEPRPGQSTMQAGSRPFRPGTDHARAGQPAQDSSGAPSATM